MLDGVSDQFVDDEAKRYRKIGADQERIGVDCYRPGLVRATRCRCDFPTKVDEIPVKRYRFDVVRFMQLLMNGGYGRNARGGIVKLTRGGSCGLRVHVQQARYNLQAVPDAVIDLLYQQVFLPSAFFKSTLYLFKLFSFVDLGGKVGDSTKTGHKVKLSLSVHPDGQPSEPLRIVGRDPEPALDEDEGN